MDHPLVKEAIVHEDLNIFGIWKNIEDQYSIKFKNYWDLQKWSVDNFEEFWQEAWKYLGIISSVSFERVIAPYKTIEEVPEWFPGSKMNFAENLLRHETGTAFIILGEENPTPRRISYQELREQTAIMASAFRKSSIKKGDIIACFMPNRLEAVVSMLAAASVGAIFTAANPLMGGRAVLSRFSLVKPKVLIAVDRHVFKGEEKNSLDILNEIVNELPSLEHVIIVPSNEKSLQKDISVITKSCFYPDFLAKGYDERGHAPAPYYEQLPFSHPFIISFTSGTTGPPKGVVHSAGAMLMVSLKDLSLHFDVKKSDILWVFYSPGWMSWNYYLSSLALGCCLVLYEGFPFFTGGGYWDLSDKLGVTISFLIPSILEEMERRNLVPDSESSLKDLKLLLSGSCHLKSHTFDFIYQKIKPSVFFTVGYGSTETMAMIAGLVKCLSVYKEELQAPSLGFDVKALNEEGHTVMDELGELVITKPFPSMPLYLWNDEHNAKYKSIFFEKFPGVFCHSDMCIVSSKTKGIIVFGRTDETIKQRGARFGSAEIYEVVNCLESVSDSLCVSCKNELGDEIAALFIKMKCGYKFNEEFVVAVRKNIKNELTYRHVPEIIHQIKDIPYNVNGKKMEVLVKKILAHIENISLDTIANPESVKEYQEFAKSLYVDSPNH